MKIRADKDELLKSLTVADSVISSKNINTILSNCKISVTKNTMTIIGTDNEIAIRTYLDVISDDSATFVINGKKLNSILKELPSDELEITVGSDYKIRITSMSQDVNGHYDLIGINADEYPEISPFYDDSYVEIEQHVLKEMVKRVSYAASHDTIKPIFNGLFFISEDSEHISVVATDSRRLSLLTRSVAKLSQLKEGIIIPLKTVNEISKILDIRGTCKFSLSSNQCFFKIGDTEIISRIVEGQYPNFRQVIPQEFLFNALIDTKKLTESFRRALVFTREPAHTVTMIFSKDTLTITAQTPELGEAEEKLLIECDNKADISIGVNAMFMIDALKEIETETVNCGVTGQMSPITLRPENDTQTVAVVMPIQIKSK
jgi:DNA polymerase III subunit beta